MSRNFCGLVVSVCTLISLMTPISSRAQGAPPAAWTGFHVGAELGGGIGTSRRDFSVGSTTGDFSVQGVVGGVTAGYDRQFGHLVAGIEGDAWGSSVGGSKSCPNTAFTCETDSQWLAAFRPRVGYALDRVVFYGTGGLAFGAIHVGSVFLPRSQTGDNYSRIEPGWTAGAGMEVALLSRWTVKAEYLFVQLDNANGPVVNAPTHSSTTKFRENILQIGVSYWF